MKKAKELFKKEGLRIHYEKKLSSPKYTPPTLYRSITIFRKNQEIAHFQITGDILNTASYATKVTIPVRHFVYKGDLSVPPAEGKKLFENLMSLFIIFNLLRRKIKLRDDYSNWRLNCVGGS